MNAFTFGSVCSGIEAASVAWEPLGCRALWLAEIEPFPSAVLAHHFPSVPNLGDMTAIAGRIRDGSLEPPDVLVGGTPCQAFSVAGLRGGLADPRGALTIAYVDLADAIDAARSVRGLPPAITVWENVPGVLSSKDNAFGCFLGALAGESCELQPPGGKWPDAGCVFGPTRAVAWRILDAQYFGVAQRRRRVFVVSGAGDGFDPCAVLFEFEGLRRDTAPSREAGKSSATDAGIRVKISSHWDGVNNPHPTISQSHNTGGIGQSNQGLFSQRGAGLVSQARHATDYVQPVAGTLDAGAGRSRGAGTSPAMLTPVVCMAHGQGGAEIADNRSPTLTCNHEAPIVVHGTQDPCVSDKAFALGRNNGAENAVCFQPRHYSDRPRMGGEPSEICHTLSASHGGGDYAPHVAYGIPDNWIGRKPENVGRADQNGPQGDGINEDVCFTQNFTDRHAVAYSFDSLGSNSMKSSNQHSGCHQTDLRKTLDTTTPEPSKNQGGIGIVQAMEVRRLTPTECERLQGFPDSWTDVPYRGKPAADGPRYKALGNSMAVPCMAWIGRRIIEAVRVAA